MTTTASPSSFLRIPRRGGEVRKVQRKNHCVHWTSTPALASGYLHAGVSICGGCLRVPGIVTLAENIFHMNVTTGHAIAISGLADTLNQPEFTTTFGLVKYGALRHQKIPPPLPLLAKFTGLFTKFAAILKWIFKQDGTMKSE